MSAHPGGDPESHTPPAALVGSPSWERWPYAESHPWTAPGVRSSRTRTGGRRAGRTTCSRGYAEPHRRYHTAVHVDEMVAALDHRPVLASRPTARSGPSSRGSADAVYDPMRGDNEAASAQIAREVSAALGLAAAYGQRVVDRPGDRGSRAAARESAHRSGARRRPVDLRRVRGAGSMSTALRSGPSSRGVPGARRMPRAAPRSSPPRVVLGFYASDPPTGPGPAPPGPTLARELRPPFRVRARWPTSGRHHEWA